jgi:hypothetical protein
MREFLIRAAIDFTPEWGRDHVRAAFDSDKEAASRLSTALHDWQRAEMTRAMYQARVKPAAFRQILEHAMTQSHEYGVVLRLARGRKGLIRWMRYAGFEPHGLLP